MWLQYTPGYDSRKVCCSTEMDDTATIINNQIAFHLDLQTCIHTLLTVPVSTQVSPDAVMWLWERLIGLRGLLRAISASVLGECFATSCSPDDSVLLRPRPPSPAPPISLGPSPFPRMTVSFSSTVAPTVRLVSVATSLSGYDPLGEGWSR